MVSYLGFQNAPKQDSLRGNVSKLVRKAAAISKWQKKKKKSNGSGRKAKWPGMEKLLALAVRKRRDKGLKVRTSWPVRKGTELIKKIDGAREAEAFKGSGCFERGR